MMNPVLVSFVVLFVAVVNAGLLLDRQRPVPPTILPLRAASDRDFYSIVPTDSSDVDDDDLSFAPLPVTKDFRAEKSLPKVSRLSKPQPDTIEIELIDDDTSGSVDSNEGLSTAMADDLPEPAPLERLPYHYNITADAYDEYQDLITAGARILTKGEMKRKLLKWATDNDVLDDYRKDFKEEEGAKEVLRQSILENLAGDALKAYKRVLLIKNDDKLSQKEECQLLTLLYDSSSPIADLLIPDFHDMQECMLPRYQISPPDSYYETIMPPCDCSFGCGSSGPSVDSPVDIPFSSLSDDQSSSSHGPSWTWFYPTSYGFSKNN